LVKKSILYSVATILTAITLATPPAGAAERAARAPSVLPPHEIITIVRSAGLNPVSRPTRRGMNYLLRAVDEGGQEVRVVVDGRIGEVIAVTPVAYGAREIDPMRPSVYDSGPPVYEVGPPVYRSAPPAIIIEEESEPPVYRRATPVVPAPIAPPPREREVVIVPPPSAPDIILAPPAPPSGVAVAPPETDGNELLPPPPPRFPQRVITTPNTKPAPKPAKSAANPQAAKSNAAAPANKQPPAPAADSKFAPQAP
jgi:hypothetical protein